MPDTITMIDQNGDAHEVPSDQAGFFASRGYRADTPTDIANRTLKEAREEEFGGISGKAQALAGGLGRGITMGGSDVALRALAGEDAAKRSALAREANPIYDTAGTIIGMAAPGALGGLAGDVGAVARATPSGYLSRLAGEGVEAARAAGGIRGALGSIAISGAEGAAQNAGMYLSDVALGNRDLTAEGMAGALGAGFGFGGVAGGATYGLEAGTMAARRMFSRAMEGGEGAASDAASAWNRTSDGILTAHDETATLARQRLDEIRAQRAELEKSKALAGSDMAQAKLDALQKPLPEAPTVAPEAVPAPSGAPAPSAPVAEPPTGLEAQLRQMKAQADAGVPLGEMRPLPSVEDEQRLATALDDYATKRAKVNDWIARFKNPRTEYDVEGSIPGETPLIRGRRTQALDEDVFVEQSNGNIRTIGKGEHTLEDITPNSRILARSNADSFSAGTALDDAYNDAIERAKLAETHAEMDAALKEAQDVENQIHAYIRSAKPENAAVIDQIQKVRAEAGRTGYHAAFTRAERAAERDAEATVGKLPGVNAEQEAAYQETLAGTAPRAQPSGSFLEDAVAQGRKMQLEATNAERAKLGLPPLEEQPPLVHDVHEASQVLGDYEKSAANLVDAMGPEAPAEAQKAAQGYRDAEATADRKQLDRTTQAIDDHVTKTPEQRIASAKQARLEADAKLGKLKAEEIELKAKIKKAPKGKAAPTAPAAPPSRLARFASGVEKVGEVAEMAGMAGIPGIPKPSDIPVIGPLLGAFLKFRALTGKLMGRIPASGEAKAAALAAKTKDKIAMAIDHSLGVVERSAAAARNPAVTITTELGRRLIDDGQPDAPKDASTREQAAVRIREINAAVANPQLITAQVRQQMAGIVDPDLIAAAEQHLLAKFQYLDANAPKTPPPNPLNPRPQLPSQPETDRFAQRLAVANNPLVAFHATQNGTLTPVMADALQNVYPQLFAQAQARLLHRLTEVRATVPYNQQLRMGLLYNVPLDRLSDPGTIAVLQTAIAPKSPAAPTQNPTVPPTPSIAGQVDLGKLYQTSADRRAARS